MRDGASRRFRRARFVRSGNALSPWSLSGQAPFHRSFTLASFRLVNTGFILLLKLVFNRES